MNGLMTFFVKCYYILTHYVKLCLIFAALVCMKGAVQKHFDYSMCNNNLN